MTPGFETLAIHAGQDPDPATGAVVTPIYQVSTFAQTAPGEHQGYEYSRAGNPTRTALETCIAALEGGVRGFAFASGLAAEDCVIRALLKPGDHVVIPNDAYGGTYRLFARVAARWGIEFTPASGEEIAAEMTERTKQVWIESPTNPLLGIVDIAAAAEIAHDRGALVVVDNTFASPWLQQPLTLGADIVVHSSTKYLGGHSDVIGGAVVVADAEIGERIAFDQMAIGGIAGPFDCWLTLRGIKTLGARMRLHCANAARVAAMLSEHDAVERVYYPGLASHQGHDIAVKQMRDFGGMVSFTVRGGEAKALDVVTKTKLFTLAESLGAVESLIEHPGRMSHVSVVGSPLEVDPSLIRLSVGIEDAVDLLADLSQALAG